MEQVNIARLKLNIKHQIMDYNPHCETIFGLTSNRQTFTKESLNNANICDFIDSPNPSTIDRILDDMENKKYVNYLLFKNILDKNSVEQGVLFLYLKITKIKNEYLFEMANWIQWLDLMHRSLEQGYAFISDFHNNNYISNFKSISDIYCLKALYPLLMHIPSEHFEFINNRSLYNVMRSFIQLRKNKNSKDYPRKAYSRINTNVKQEFGLLHCTQSVGSIGLVLNTPLVDCVRNSEMCIPNTHMHHDLLVPMKKDSFLEFFMNKIP